MSHFVNRLHTYIRAALSQTRVADDDVTTPQNKWAVGINKTYPRMEKISLPPGHVSDALLIPTISKRKSKQPVQRRSTPSLEVLSTLLGTALGCRSGSQLRHYPSGGALYPIETYLIITLDTARGNEVFHYCPSSHVLERLWPAADVSHVSSLTNLEGGENYSGMIVFTSKWSASYGKYGNFSYNLGLLEAGHMAQNVLLVATALDLQTRPMCGFYDEKISQLLDVSPDTEQVVYTILLG